MKNIQIIEKSSGQLVTQYPLIYEYIEDQNDQDYIDCAWEIAIEEGVVEGNSPEKYDIEIIEDIHAKNRSDSS